MKIAAVEQGSDTVTASIVREQLLLDLEDVHSLRYPVVRPQIRGWRFRGGTRLFHTKSTS